MVKNKEVGVLLTLLVISIFVGGGQKYLFDFVGWTHQFDCAIWFEGEGWFIHHFDFDIGQLLTRGSPLPTYWTSPPYYLG